MKDDREDGHGTSLLRDRGTLIVIGLMILLVIAGAAYGIHTNDDRVPPYSMDDIPPMADGTYGYSMTISLDVLEPVVDAAVTYTDGSITAMEVGGDAVPEEDLDDIVAGIDAALTRATVDLGVEWTDGTATTGTFTVTYENGTIVFAEDGRMLSLDHSATGYSILMTLDGWTPVATDDGTL